MKTKKFSKVLCMLVCVMMVFTMLPAMGVTAEAAAVVTRTTPLDLATDANISYMSSSGTTRTANPKTTDIMDTAEGWSWNHTSKTLILSGANIDCSGNAATAGEKFGIRLVSNSNIILIEGSINTVKGGPTSDSSSGIRFIGSSGNSSISGKGTLNVTSGAGKRGSYGIFCQEGTLTVSDATITVVTSTSEGFEYGISANLDIKSGRITATGRHFGIAGNTLKMTGGKVTAFGLTAITCLGSGIVAAGARVTGANETFTSGTTTSLGQKDAAIPVVISLEPLPPATINAVYDVAGSGTGSRLEGSFDTVVTDPATGITAADKTAGNNVSLKLTVAEKATVSVPDSEKIEGVKQGDTLQYYDVKVEKTVTPSGGSATTTVLTSIPKAVRAVIPVPVGIQGKTSYTVYRIHNNVAEQIPNDPTAPEFYSVNEGGTSLTLNVKKFSTYAVITGNKALTGDATFGDATNPKNSAMDVQGKILEGEFGVYKLDVSWGAMKFDYNSKGAVWDPDTHGYTTGGAGTAGWTKESFEAGNNKIVVANHSNGDVLLSYAAKPNAVLSGTTMTVRSTNSLAGVEAANLLLAKVPNETAIAPTIDTYVWLTGAPTNLAGLNAKTYTKAGVITITAEADLTSGLTPNTP